MDLDKEYIALKKNLASLDIPLIYGMVDAKKAIKVICDTEEMTLEEFVKLGESRGKHLILLKSKFDYDDWLTSFDTAFIKENNLLDFAKFNNKIKFINLNWISDNIVYEYTLSSVWNDDIFKFQEKISTKSDQSREDKFGARLSKEEIEMVAKTLVEEEIFFKKRNDRDLLTSLIRKILVKLDLQKEDLGYFGYNEIIVSAKEYFDKHLLKKKEAELISKISKMKARKMTKVEIRSKLEITKGMLDKYYYKNRM